MENDDNRNKIEPIESKNLIAHATSIVVTCKAVKFKAASVPGYEA